MPILREHPRFRGITLPPSGWVLAVLLVVYLFTGLIGHDPWKHDDAISIGIAYDIVTHGNWLIPHLAGQPYPDAPLYYWTAALTAHLFSWLLPLHDAARLANAVFTLLALEFILLAARELHGKDYAASAPLILAGSIGFLFHAHEAQPMLAALTALTAAYWALALLPRRPFEATCFLAGAIAVGFLANGLLPVLTMLPVLIYVLWQSENWAKKARLITIAIAIAGVLIGLWIIPLYFTDPTFLATFWQRELAPFSDPQKVFVRIPRYLSLLLWYAWPALPLAAWALWSKRRVLRTKPVALPVVSFFSVLFILALCMDVRSAPALMLLPPLVLLAVPGVATLRRGAANAFDWFAMLTFTVFAAITWIGWSALVLGWPEKLAIRAVKLVPGFVGQFSIIACALAVAATLIWFWLIVTSPRSPMRSSMHWMCGLTLFWLLVTVLLMPWIDFGKTYRPLSASLAKVLPSKPGCIANANLPDSILASLDYFDGIHTLPARSNAGKSCNWLIVHGAGSEAASRLSEAGWVKVWEGGRPVNRRSTDRFRLYRREASGTKGTLPYLPVESSEDSATRRRVQP